MTKAKAGYLTGVTYFTRYFRGMPETVAQLVLSITIYVNANYLLLPPPHPPPPSSYAYALLRNVVLHTNKFK